MCRLRCWQAAAKALNNECPAQPVQGKTGQAKCTDCAAGRYSSKGATCIDCPVGKYADDAGQPSCDDCPAGTISNALATVTCSNCVKGKIAATPPFNYV